MFNQENLSTLLQVLTLIGIIFAVYLYFRKPQETSMENDIRADEKYNALRDIVINLRDNHFHTLEQKFDSHIKESQDVAIRGAEKMGSIEAKQDMILTLLNKKL